MSPNKRVQGAVSFTSLALLCLAVGVMVSPVAAHSGPEGSEQTGGAEPGRLAAAIAKLAPIDPYLQNGQVGEVTLVWRDPDARAAASVTYRVLGEPQAPIRRVQAPLGYQREVRLTGLEPGRQYAYEVRHRGRSSYGKFRANKGPESDWLRFAAFGDIGSGDHNQAAVARQLTAWQPELVVAAGDIVYERGEAEAYDKHFFEPYAALLRGAPFYPALGNHDLAAENGAGYFAAFSLPQQPARERYYTFRNGPVQFWALDSTQPLTPDSAQVRWFKQSAQASQANWKVAFFHHPPFSTNLHGDTPATKSVLVPLFKPLGIDLVIAGHDHGYERFKPQDGVTYVVTGGGGGFLYAPTGGPRTAAFARKHHFLGCVVAGESFSISAIDTAGKIFDTVTLRHQGAIASLNN